MTKNEALTMSLEVATIRWNSPSAERSYADKMVIDAIKEALSQPSDSVEQEPTVLVTDIKIGGKVIGVLRKGADSSGLIGEMLYTAPPKPSDSVEQEPDAGEMVEQEPVGLDEDALRDMAGSAFETAMAFGISTDSFERLARDVNKRIVAALAQSEQQKPFNPDWVSYRQGKLDNTAESLEETKRKEWVGLTGDDMDDITSTAMDKADAMLLTESKLKEKNHD